MSELNSILASRVSVFQTPPNQLIPFNLETRVRLDGEYYDTLGEWDAANSVFQPTRAGYYQVNAGLMWMSGLAGDFYRAYIGFVPIGSYVPAGSDVLGHALQFPTHNLSTIVYMTPNQQIHLVAYTGAALGHQILSGNTFATYLTIHRLS